MLENNNLSFDLICKDDGEYYVPKSKSLDDNESHLDKALYTVLDFESKEIKGLEFSIIRQVKDRKNKAEDSVVILMNAAIDIVVNAINNEIDAENAAIEEKIKKEKKKTLATAIGCFILGRML